MLLTMHAFLLLIYSHEDEAKDLERSHSWRNQYKSGFKQRDGAWIHDYDQPRLILITKPMDSNTHSLLSDIQGQIEIAGSPEEYYKLLNNQFTTTLRTSGREQVDITGLIGRTHMEMSQPSRCILSYTGEQWRTLK